ncbi:hypothetical protein HK104_006641 [Borealophlyctis nickersoniae]|nr:hypothetical protein HK104_006641 [Borealophlyctis nickersoniae]
MSARRITDNTPVAVKFMHKDRIPVTSWWRDRQLGMVPLEIHILKKMNHEHIVKFLEFFEDEKFFYLVMELHGTPWHERNQSASGPDLESVCDSGANSSPVTTPGSPATPPPSNVAPIPVPGCMTTLSRYGSSPAPFSSPPSVVSSSYSHMRRISQDLFECIEANPFMPEEKVRFIFKQIAEAVGYLHSNNVVHRDIKDENIVIDDNLSVKLVDFGNAQFIPKHPSKHFDAFYGTLRCAAPEILRGEPYRGPEQDVWSLGVLLYTIAFSTAPFADEHKVLSGRWARPRFRRTDGMMDLIGKMLEVDVGTRIDIEGVLAHPWIRGV